MEGVDFIGLRFQAKPQLIIEECLKTNDPTEEVRFAIFVLMVVGLKSTADKVADLTSSFGINIELEQNFELY